MRIVKWYIGFVIVMLSLGYFLPLMAFAIVCACFIFLLSGFMIYIIVTAPDKKAPTDQADDYTMD